MSTPSRLPRSSLPTPSKSSPLSSDQDQGHDSDHCSSPGLRPPSPARSRLPSLSPRLSRQSSGVSSATRRASPPSRKHSDDALSISTATTAAAGAAGRRPPSSDSDSVKMPPPPVPATKSRSASVMSNSSAGSNRTSAAKREEPKKSVLGRAGSVVRKAVNGKKDDSTKKPVATKENGHNRSMSLRSSASIERASVKEKGSMLGRTMSLRSGTKLPGAPEKKELERKPSLRSTSLAGTAKKPETTSSRAPAAATATATAGTKTTRPRPQSYVDPPTSSLSSSTNAGSAAGLRKPSSTTVGSTATAAKAHRKTSSVSNLSSTASSTINASSAAASKSKKPAFTTLQHPVDFPKPAAQQPSPRSKILPPPPLEKETIHKQTQLLQLSVLYSSSHTVYRELSTNATSKLQTRFDTLSSKHNDLRRQVAAANQKRDFLGLSAVVETPATGIDPGKRRQTIRSPEEKIQRFSESLKRLEAVQAGEHRACAKRFGEWISGYSPPPHQTVFNLDSGGEQKMPELDPAVMGKREKWIDGLGAAWQTDCANVARRIEASIRGVEAVVAAVVQKGEAEAGVVGRIAEGWLDLASGLLEETEVMCKVEREVVERERAVLGAFVKGVLNAPAVHVEDWDEDRRKSAAAAAAAQEAGGDIKQPEIRRPAWAVC